MCRYEVSQSSISISRQKRSVGQLRTNNIYFKYSCNDGGGFSFALEYAGHSDFRLTAPEFELSMWGYILEKAENTITIK